MKKLFVTGGAGFIGSAFIHLLLRETNDIEIVNFDALTYAGNLENLTGLDERHKFVHGDIRDANQVLATLPDDCDAVVNFAAESHVDRSIASAQEFVTTNVLGTQVLLDAARAKNVRRFVQISTDEVMGSLPEADENAFFTEQSELAPNSPYAASKAAAEHFVRAAHHTFGLDVVTTRCGNNYGPRQFPEKLIPLMIANALNDEPLPVYGDGRNVRDWIFVDDHARAVWQIMEKGASGAVYNIGARNEQQNLTVIKSILTALDKPETLIKFVKDRLGHDRRYAIDPTKIETEIGWRTEETWQSGLEKTVNWYLNNKDWVERVRSGAYRDFYRQQYGEI